MPYDLVLACTWSPSSAAHLHANIKYRLVTNHELLRGLESLRQGEGFQTKWNEGWLLTYLEHEVTSVHAVLSLLDLPFVLGGAVVWTTSFLVILSIGIILLWLVQVIFFFVV